MTSRELVYCLCWAVMASLETRTGLAPVASDEPIRTQQDDLLGRARLADLIAVQAVSPAPDAGLVIALTGPWGVGKTSVLNLVEESLGAHEHALAIRFNPWLSSGADLLPARFLMTLASEFTRLGAPASVVGAVTDYAASLSDPAAFGDGQPRGVAAAAAQVALSSQAGARVTESPRDRLARHLHPYPGRFVVFIDDVDRLEPEQLRAVIRLVKLIGDLPRITYVLAFSRERVEATLRAGGDANVGRGYMEKIVQIEHHLGATASDRLLALTLTELRAALRAITDLDDDILDGDELVTEGVGALLTSLRQGRRWVNAATGAVWLRGDDIAVEDLLALEALRVCEPDVHGRLPTIADALTGNRQGRFDRASASAEQDWRRVQDVVAIAQNPAATRTVLAEIFPAAGRLLEPEFTEVVERTWRFAAPQQGEARVADPALLELYLSGN